MSILWKISREIEILVVKTFKPTDFPGAFPASSTVSVSATRMSFACYLLVLPLVNTLKTVLTDSFGNPADLIFIPKLIHPRVFLRVDGAYSRIFSSIFAFDYITPFFHDS